MQIAKDSHRLTPREIEALEIRFGLDGNGYHALEAAGKALGITRERVRRLAAKALQKLRPFMLRQLRGVVAERDEEQV